MKVAVVQTGFHAHVAQNLECAQQLVEQASAHGAELVVLPEYFCGMGMQDTDKLAWAEALGDGPCSRPMAAWAQRNAVWLVGGTVPIRGAQPARVRNTCMLFNPQGERAAYYDKIHLFRFATETEHYDEAAVIEAGHQPVVAQMVDRSGAVWKLGLSVCYDLRFPEAIPPARCARRSHFVGACGVYLYHRPGALGVAAARSRSGKPMLDAGCCPRWAAREWPSNLGAQHGGRPLGQVLAQQRAAGVGVSYAVLDAALLQQVRQRLPALEHRCL